MGLITSPAICLRRLDYSETSQILQLFTHSHGVIRVIAKGAHRRTKAGHGKYDGGLDLLDLGTAVYIENSADLWTLTEWTLSEGHLGLRRTLRQLQLGLLLSEVSTALLHEHDPFPAVFERLRLSLGALAAPNAAPTHDAVALAYCMSLLDVAGYLPELALCQACGRPIGASAAMVGFVPSSGGVYCPDCADTAPDRYMLPAALTRLATQLAALPFQRMPRLTPAQSHPLLTLVALHVRQITGRPLTMPGLLTAPARMKNPAGRGERPAGGGGNDREVSPSGGQAASGPTTA